MGHGRTAALLVTAATAVTVGCGGTASPAGRPRATAPAAISLSGFQACRLLLADLARRQGVPDLATLRRIADHVTSPRIAADARTAVRDIDHTGVAPLAVSLLRDECARAGVRIPAS